MLRQTVPLKGKLGLHARVAFAVTEALKGLRAAVTVRHGPLAADAADVMDLLSLAAQHGDEVTLEAEGEDARTAMEKIIRILESEDGAGN